MSTKESKLNSKKSNEIHPKEIQFLKKNLNLKLSHKNYFLKMEVPLSTKKDIKLIFYANQTLNRLEKNMKNETKQKFFFACALKNLNFF